VTGFRTAPQWRECGLDRLPEPLDDNWRFAERLSYAFRMSARNLFAEVDTNVLIALAKWEASASGHEHTSAEQLADEMRVDAAEVGQVARSVKRLVDAGFIDAINVTGMGSPYPSYLISGLTALGIGVARGLNTGPDATPESAEPAFMGVRRVDIAKNSRQVFVAYPFSIPADDYRSALRRVGDRFGVRFVYADEQITNQHILAKIYALILESAFGLYDLTGWNANVTLELGIALGLKETAYFLLNPAGHGSADAPADLRGFDRIDYKSYGQLEARLNQLFQGLGLRSQSS
jgi:hypothetical protein